MGVEDVLCPNGRSFWTLMFRISQHERLPDFGEAEWFVDEHADATV